jgi:hypothetical protein
MTEGTKDDCRPPEGVPVDPLEPERAEGKEGEEREVERWDADALLFDFSSLEVPVLRGDSFVSFGVISDPFVVAIGSALDRFIGSDDETLECFPCLEVGTFRSFGDLEPRRSRAGKVRSFGDGLFLPESLGDFRSLDMVRGFSPLSRDPRFLLDPWISLGLSPS